MKFKFLFHRIFQQQWEGGEKEDNWMMVIIKHFS